MSKKILIVEDEIFVALEIEQMDTSKNRVILASSVRTVHAGLTKYGF